MAYKLISFLLITYFAITFTICESKYLKFYIEDYCFDSNVDQHIELLNDSAINTSIVLSSSRMDRRISNKTCALRIVMSKKVDGLIVTVHNISIDNTSDKICEDFIEFGSSPVGKWCNTSDAQSLVFSDSSTDIMFRAKFNSYSNFSIVITPFQNPVLGQYCTSSARFRCENSSQYQCISDVFSCDGFMNCPNGFDENNCPKMSTLRNDSQNSDTVVVTNAFNETSETTTYETTESDYLFDTNSNYHEYNILDYCNTSFAHQILLKSNSNGTVYPAILKLLPNPKISNQTCVIQFSLPESKWYDHYGLALGIDDISIKSNNSKSCDDYIQISGSDFSSQIQWCENKNDTIGNSFRGSGFIAIAFHAGEDSESHFILTITPFEDSFFKSCPFSSTLKCNDGNGNYECIDKVYKCDGHNNCPKSDDEQGCSTPTPPTPTPTPTPTTTTTTTTPTTTTSKTTTSTSKTTTKPMTTTVPSTTTSGNHTIVPSTTPSGNHTTTTPSPSHSGLSTGSIVLIVIGTLFGVILIIAMAYLFVRKRRQNTAGYSSLND